MKEIKFDSLQKKTGINKYGHYQLGKETCPYCKNDKTEKDKKGIYHCYACNAVFHYKN